MKDQKNRDEILSYEGHIFVLAGAGTGKSTIIAEKIIWLLKNRKINSIHDVAAITYTNKAAAELKWKIEEKLSAMISKSTNAGDIDIFQESLKNISDASIRTIHSFCATLLRKYGYHERIDPMFSILSKNETDAHFTEAFQSYVKEYIEAGNSEILSVWKEIVHYSQISHIEDLQQIFREISEKTHLLSKVKEKDLIINSKEDLKINSAEIFNDYINQFFYYLNFYNYEEESRKSENSLGTKLKLLKSLLEDKDNLENLIRRFDIYNKDIMPGRLRGSTKFIEANCPFDNIQKILTTYLKFLATFHSDGDIIPYKDMSSDEMNIHFVSRKYKDHCGITLENLKSEYIRNLWYHALIHFQKYFAEYKIQKSLLSYNDIIYYTSKIINNESVLSDVRKKYKYIFVDEYQDTDPVQTEIFTAISGLSPEKTDNENPSSLIRVGDAKQSIYSFRGADLETFYYEKTRFHVKNSGLLQSLNVNMRSHPSLIAFVNRLFHKQDTETSLDIVDYESLNAGTEKSRLIEPGVYLTQFFNETPAESRSRSREMRNAEAAWMADQIQNLKATDPDLTICVLFKAMRDNIEPYVRELKNHRIAFDLVGRRYYGENYTKKYLVLFLQCLYNPQDKIALTGFLRSPVASLTDIEVNEIISSDTIYFMNYFNIIQLTINNSVQKKLENVIELLNTCLDLLRNQSLSSLLWYLFENSNFYPITYKLKNSEIILDSLDRIFALGSLTDSMIFSSYYSRLHFFLTEIEKLENVPEVDEPGGGFNINNSVQFMSYHKSKGLEFDVIFMPDLFYKSMNQSAKIFLESKPASSDVLFQYNNDLSYRKTGIENTEFIIEDRKKNELVRLVYVAMTRAKERLYLPLHLNPPKNTILDYLWSVLIEKFKIEPEFQGNEQWIKSEFHFEGEPGYFFINWKNLSIPEIKKVFEPNPEDKLSIKGKLPKFEIKNSSKPVPFYSFISPTTVMKQSKLQSDNLDYDRYRDQKITQDWDEKEDPDIFKGEVLEDPVTRGIITHSLFELIDLKKPKLTDEIKNSVFYGKAYQDAEQHECIAYFNRVIEIYQNSRLFELMRNANIIGKEIPYSHFPATKTGNNEHRQIVVGYIDLLINTGNNHLLVIDYKTNRKPDTMPIEKFHETLIKTYEIPMEMYKNALEDAFPTMQIQKALYHTDSGSLIYYEG